MPCAHIIALKKLTATCWGVDSARYVLDRLSTCECAKLWIMYASKVQAEDLVTCVEGMYEQADMFQQMVLLRPFATACHANTRINVVYLFS